MLHGEIEKNAKNGRREKSHDMMRLRVEDERDNRKKERIMML
jgi:hypothetical protein